MPSHFRAVNTALGARPSFCSQLLFPASLRGGKPHFFPYKKGFGMKEKPREVDQGWLRNGDPFGRPSPFFLQAWLSQRRYRVLAGPLKCSDNKKTTSSQILRQKINQGQVTGSQNCPSVHPRGQIFTSQTLCRRQPSPNGQSRAHQGERQLSSSMRPSCCL